MARGVRGQGGVRGRGGVCVWLGQGLCVAGGHAWQGGMCGGGMCMTGGIVCNMHAPLADTMATAYGQ